MIRQRNSLKLSTTIAERQCHLWPHSHYTRNSQMIMPTFRTWLKIYQTIPRILTHPLPLVNRVQPRTE